MMDFPYAEKPVEQFTCARDTGAGPLPGPYTASRSLRARSSGVPSILIDCCFPIAETESYANALSARTRSLNGSAFCEKRASAWRVFASMILVHQSCRNTGVAAKRV